MQEVVVGLPSKINRSLRKAWLAMHVEIEMLIITIGSSQGKQYSRVMREETSYFACMRGWKDEKKIR